MSTAELARERDERTHQVRELVWHLRTKVEQNELRMVEVRGFLGRLEERRDLLRARTPRDESAPVLEEALEELDSTHEEIRVIGEEMDRRAEQLVACEGEAAAKLRFHRRLMERAPMPFFLTDENGMIADANDEAARLLHVAPAYLRNKPIVNFVSRKDVTNARSFVRAVGRSDEVLENVLAFRPRRGGPVRVAEVRACTLERQKERAIGWLVREVRSTDADERGARTTEPPSSGAAEALAAISHELRTPIQTIQTAVSLLRSSLPRELDGRRVHAHCASILRATDAMSRLVLDLEDAAKVDAGVFSIERSRCDLRRLVEELVTANQPRATRRELTLESRLPHEAVIVDGDFVRLTQVIANFIDNALKFTDAKRSIRVLLEVQGDRARVEVIDEGRGIAPHDLPRVFDRRWQAKVTASLGSGLGLWLARAIAEAHGGTVGAASVLGSGSRFWLEVPLRHE